MTADFEGFDPGTRALGRPFVALARCDSTMDEVRERLAAGEPEGVTVVADLQTAGRGTHGRAWESPSGTDLYLSVGLRPQLPLERLGFLALASGLAVADAVDATLGRPAALVKWPNDVLVAGSKIAGVLVESRSLGSRVEAVVGIGLNVNRRTFAPALAATSLARESGEDHRRDRVLGLLLQRLETRLAALEAGVDATLAALEDRLAYRGERCRIGDTVGVVRRVDATGGIVLDVAGRQVVCLAGRLVPEPIAT